MTDLPCTSANTATWKRDGFVSSDTEENSQSRLFILYIFFQHTTPSTTPEFVDIVAPRCQSLAPPSC